MFSVLNILKKLNLTQVKHTMQRKNTQTKS